MTETYISVDIEASGPVPAIYSMLSFGACSVADESSQFYAELQPVSDKFEVAALQVSGLSMEQLAAQGVSPRQAMTDFAQWLSGFDRPIFVGFNAPFDWAFINYYFIKYIGNNPFGFAALDIKAYFMGAFHGTWEDTRSSKIAQRLNLHFNATHHALEDAIAQARLFKHLLKAP